LAIGAGFGAGENAIGLFKACEQAHLSAEINKPSEIWRKSRCKFLWDFFGGIGGRRRALSKRLFTRPV
jgi:hypothetical protein